jgi:hypothetical protein
MAFWIVQVFKLLLNIMPENFWDELLRSRITKELLKVGHEGAGQSLSST